MLKTEYTTEADRILAEEYSDFISSQNNKLSKARIKFKNTTGTWPSVYTDLSPYGYNNVEEEQKRKNEQTKLKNAGFSFTATGEIILPKHTLNDIDIDKNSPDDKTVDLLKKDTIDQCNEITLAYLRASEQTNCTKTQDGTIEDIKSKSETYINNLAKQKGLSSSVAAKLNKAVMNSIVNLAKAEYQNSISKHPREINNKTPYVLSNQRKNELTEYIKRGQQDVLNDTSSLMSKSAQNGSCPNSSQMDSYINESVKRATAKNLPENATSDDISYISEQINNVHDKCMTTYKQYAQNVKITNSFPGSSESDAKNKSGKAPSSSSKKNNDKFYGSEYTRTNVSFSGCDMTMTAEMKTTDGTSVSVLIGELQTVSYSIYRKLSPILNIGNVNAKDYVGGPRTIAGSLIFTVFNQHWGTELMDKFAQAEGYPMSQKILMDEIAPINLTVSMANEYGISARLAIYGVRLFSEGQVMSINDIYTENTYQYVALNIDYLTNVNLSEQKKQLTEAKVQADTSPKNSVLITPTDGSTNNNINKGNTDKKDNSSDTGVKNTDPASIAPSPDNPAKKTPNSDVTAKDVYGNNVNFESYSSQADCEKDMNQKYQDAQKNWLDSYPNATAKERIDMMNHFRAMYLECINNVRQYYGQQKE